LTVVLLSEYTEDVERLGIITRKRLRGCVVNRSELDTINQQATITVGETEYAINRVMSEDDYVTVLELARHELQEQARPGYRRQT